MVCSVADCSKPSSHRGLCSMHYSRLRRHGDLDRGYTRVPLADRFWPKVDTSGEHWLWTGSKDQHGYGRIQRGGRGGGILRAHQAAWLLCVGPVPEGKEIDHLCRVPSCCKPSHLEPVTHRENMRRGKAATATRCQRGHEFTPENTHRIPQGSRLCRACMRIRDARRAARKRELAVAA